MIRGSAELLLALLLAGESGVVRLPRLSPHEAASLEPLQTGIHRKLPANAMKKGRWENTRDGGKLWSLEVRSSGAAGMRVHFNEFAVGKGRVRIRSSQQGVDKVAGPYTGVGPDGSGAFWSETLPGECVRIEFEPESARFPTVPFRIDRISHLWAR